MAESKTPTTEQRGQNQQGQGAEQRSGSRDWMARRDPFLSTPFAGTFSPFDLMRRMSDEMDRMFEQFYDDVRGTRRWAPSGGAAWSPQIELFQKEDTLVVRAELPGVKKEDVNVEISDDRLELRGERRAEHRAEREGFYQTERSYGSFYRAIPLPEGVIGERAEATFRDGVLEITMPAPPSEVSRPRRLEIRDESMQKK